MLRRIAFVFRMFVMTLIYWGITDWVKFWFGAKHQITLNGFGLVLRDNRYMAKIADLAMAWEVIIDDVYDVYPATENDVIVDIGGHIGSFSVKASAKVGMGKVYVFEPFPSTFDVLKKNVKDLQNVHAQQIAVSNTRGSQKLYFSQANPAENSLLRKTENSIDVPLMTLHDIFEQNSIENVDLMKIDCEGAEYDILYSAGEDLRKVQKLVMEVHEPKYFDIPKKYSISGLVTVLEKSGFTVKFKRENPYQGYIYAHR